MRGSLAALTLVLAAAAAPSAVAQSSPSLPWPALLPPQETSTAIQPGPVEYCRQANLKCVEDTAVRMRALRRRLGCDHRAVFATTYLLLTEEVLKTMQREPGFFRYPDWLIYVDVLFARYYFDALQANEARRPVPDAWQVSFDTAARGDANGAQDMLLGINAHVQRDMPYVLAEMGLRARDGGSRKVDHDAVNEILRRGYERIVREIADKYDPLITYSNSEATPLDDSGGLETVKGWREGVWRNAERLLNARTREERALVEQQIERDSAAWARAIASGETAPGYRAYRDAYCRARLRFGDEAGRRGAALVLRMRPRRVASGQVRRYRFRLVQRGPGRARQRPVRRAVIRFAGRRVRTGRRGRASMKVRLRRRGRRYAVARKRGMGSAYAVVRVVRKRR